MAVVTSQTGTDLASPPDATQTYFHRRFLRRIMAKLYHSRWADAVDIPANGGRNIILRRWLYLSLQLGDLQEGIPPTGQTPNLDDFTVALSQQGDFIVFSDMVKWTQQD